jgi:hypothetical protein
MGRSLAFASACPGCGRQQPQEFAFTALVRLLQRGYPVAAYCGVCDEFWEIESQMRHELREVLAVACGGEPLGRG